MFSNLNKPSDKLDCLAKRSEGGRLLLENVVTATWHLREKMKVELAHTIGASPNTVQRNFKLSLVIESVINRHKCPFCLESLKRLLNRCKSYSLWLTAAECWDNILVLNVNANNSHQLLPVIAHSFFAQGHPACLDGNYIPFAGMHFKNANPKSNSWYEGVI